MRNAAVVLAISSAFVSTEASAQQWSVGIEREVDQGTYMKLVAADAGWRVWRIETRSEATCKAVKSARGRPHPAPLGLNAVMTGGTPFVEVARPWSRSQFSYNWHGRYSGFADVRYRPLGARFWESSSSLKFDASSIGEQPIEVAVETWEYPAISVGVIEEEAVFDFAGLAWAQQQVMECEREIADAIAAAPPQWTRQPQPLFPDAALNAGVLAGEVTLACTGNANGTIIGCTIVSENPLGYGFGQAAVTAMRDARTTPRPTSAGTRSIRLTVRFSE